MNITTVGRATSAVGSPAVGRRRATPSPRLSRDGGVAAVADADALAKVSGLHGKVAIDATSAEGVDLHGAQL
jgi:hypothetical protein